jgi:hypothetical protein
MVRDMALGRGSHFLVYEEAKIRRVPANERICGVEVVYAHLVDIRLSMGRAYQYRQKRRQAKKS